MAIRPLTTLRHAVTAFMLLIAVLISVEIWMRVRNVPSAMVVASQVPASDQSLLVPSAVSHHELRRLQTTKHQARGRETPITFRVNSLGCRGDEVDTVAKVGTRRILLLGDDTICGTAVAENETVSAWLKKFLSKTTTANVEVINGGVPGYCPLLSALKFEHDLAKLKPDVVLLHVDMTDIADDASYRSLVLQEGNHAVCSHATLRLRPKLENSLIQFVKQSATASWVLTKTRQHGPELLTFSTSSLTDDVGLHWIADNPPDLRLQVDHALTPIRDLQDSVVRSGGRLIVTTSPVLWQIVSAEEAPELSRRCQIKGTTPFSGRFPFEILASFCKESQIDFCDTSTAFHRDQAAKLFSKETTALSRLGMALYAREIARHFLADPPPQWNE